MGWLITLGVVFLLAILPLGVIVVYNADGPMVRIIAGPLKILVVPRPKKVPKKKKKAPKKKAAPEPGKQTGEPQKQTSAPPKAEKTAPAEPGKPAPKVEKAVPPEPQKPAHVDKIPEPHPPRKSVSADLEKKGGSWTDFLPFVKLGLNFLGNFRRKLRIKRLELKLILAGDDPCNVAVNYGRAWAAVGNLMPQLERLFVIKERNVEVECDFTTSETKVFAHLNISITLGRLIALIVSYGLRALKTYLSISNKRKGGAAK